MGAVAHHPGGEVEGDRMPHRRSGSARSSDRSMPCFGDVVIVSRTGSVSCAACSSTAPKGSTSYRGAAGSATAAGADTS